MHRLMNGLNDAAPFDGNNPGAKLLYLANRRQTRKGCKKSNQFADEQDNLQTL